MDLPTSHRNPTLRVDKDLIATGGNDYFGLALNKILEREIDNPKAIEQMEYQNCSLGSEKIYKEIMKSKFFINEKFVVDRVYLQGMDVGVLFP